MESAVALSRNTWIEQSIRPQEYEKYLHQGRCFIDEERISRLLEPQHPEKEQIRGIIAKALDLQRLEPEETAALIHLPPEEQDLWDEVFAAAGAAKEKVYGSRIVTFAPLYVSNLCVNDCTYCGYRCSNRETIRTKLARAELEAEVQALIRAGHKRLIMVYGEHPSTDADFIAETVATAYGVKDANGEIRRANINAAPFTIDKLKLLKETGIGTYQVFQETYHRDSYAQVHGSGTKADYLWRLYSLHRSIEAGADDVGIGALFGLYDWRYEVLGLLLHTMDLEHFFGGIGPHTISFPRLEPAVGTSLATNSPWLVDDGAFKRLVAILRLSVPYTGLILTCRERPAVRSELLPLGITQLDFGSNIGIGEYSAGGHNRHKEQFQLNDPRSLDQGIRWLAEQGHLTSFCTAGYRCGRTGDQFMDIAKQGKVHALCMPNAILTFKEYLLDYASPETRQIGEALIKKETAKLHNPEMRTLVQEYLQRTEHGERDLYV